MLFFKFYHFKNMVFELTRTVQYKTFQTRCPLGFSERDSGAMIIGIEDRFAKITKH